MLVLETTKLFFPLIILGFLPIVYCRKTTPGYGTIVGIKTIFPFIGNEILICFSTVGNLHVISKISYLRKCNVLKYCFMNGNLFSLDFFTFNTRRRSLCRREVIFLYMIFPSVLQPQVH